MTLRALPSETAPTPSRRVRLDQLLVERGLAETCERAQALVLARAVMVDGTMATRSAAFVPPGATVEVLAGPRFASRGGEKLDHALARTGIDVAGQRCLDIGASTGGFTDCLLQRGAAYVTAVDVCYGQLAQHLRDDARVDVRERTNARALEPLADLADMAVIDVSFISLSTVLPAVLHSLRAGAEIMALVKPQFEAGRAEVAKGGVVHDPLVHAACVGRLVRWAIDHGLRVRGVVRSPLLGPAGNREFFLWLHVPEAGEEAVGA